ncbi:NAD(P)-binding protein [Coniochaeta ligniaria NRRL 30616]|uniref:D-xylose 1-dehydrogenase (NADP(+), D-xylono-1,5-lactone-forming) n=1 Tax=Coniochaeta ligniaria NRRL 30616 TaxID=1408157 RepID=A0A1J7JQ56_9PEZI|nr:NAD(P)-binding protein [Coniochaeta ligniaria NRRL 30616]
MAADKPTIRWGIIATGLIASWFAADISIPRPDAKANHIIQAIGSSSYDKGKKFAETHVPGKSPTIGTYEEVFANPEVDIVYIGTPHAFHKQNCLDAIKHGKHVLCEKAFALNAAEAREVFEAAAEKGVFVMEAMWTRFFPLVKSLQHLLHTDKVIGEVKRVFCDFGLQQDIPALPAGSRLKDPALGAGSLLDIGIYSLTWGLLGLGQQTEMPKIVASQHLVDGVDVASAVIVSFPQGQQGILTSTTFAKTPRSFCRIEGTKGAVVVEGFVASAPASYAVHLDGDEEPKKYEFERIGKGFYWEADAVAVDIAAGRKQSEVMPWAETIRVLSILDEVRRQGGARFPMEG